MYVCFCVAISSSLAVAGCHVYLLGMELMFKEDIEETEEEEFCRAFNTALLFPTKHKMMLDAADIVVVKRCTALIHVRYLLYQM